MSKNVSTGTVRVSSIMQTTFIPTFANAGFLFTTPFLFVVSKSLTMVASSSHVCPWNMAVKPAVKILQLSGMSIKPISQMILLTARQGGSLQITNPLSTSSTEQSFSFTRTFSPGLANLTSSSSHHNLSTLYLFLVGMRVILFPTLIVPLSTFPMTIVPLSLYLSNTGILKGPAGSRPSIFRESSSPTKVGTLVLLSEAATHVLHHGHTLEVTSSMTFAPVRPEMGMNLTSFLILNPHPFKKGRNFVTHSSNLFFSHFTVGSSILLMTTTRYETPKVLASIACSRVCPPRSNPVSNSPFLAEMTKTAISA
mmetsp:Transcript_4342/g.5650  ORF Transcript_4342/g.5650 Transcript_4342/m.5650 type:complete len:310 (-) Transcript_4342:294-1223(-)